MKSTMNRAMLAGLGIGAMILVGASARGEETGSRSNMVLVTTDDGGEAQRIEIRVENGEVSAKVNGKEVPADRIRNENGQIILLDEQGNPINAGFFTADGEVGNDLYEKLREWYQVAGRPIAVGESEPKVMIGITMGTVDAALAKHLRVKAEEVTLVNAVYEGLPADEAGLEVYDVIVAIDGKRPAGGAAVTEALAGKQPDDELSFTVIQAGKEKEIRLKVAAFDAKSMQTATVHGEPLAPHAWALTLDPKDHRGLSVPLLLDPQRDFGLVRPAVPAPGTPSTEGGAAMQEKMDRLSERMAGLEKRLERLVEMLEKRNP